jgi:excinuclease UvrABC ATPase subunit
MHFLPDLYVPCDVCHGRRYNRETLEVRYKGLNIHEVLELTVEDALKPVRAGAVDRAQARDPERRRA